jgi:TolB-like protein/DNA-binding winged helix-turn-helix (wHTH) protein/Flp pilus assembly protein TadD
MEFSSDQGLCYEFGPYTLDAARGALQGPDGDIRLRPKSFQLLLCLVRNQGRLVSRSELFEAVWGNAAVTDDSLTQCLVEIRRALGDASRQMVRTVPRRGYLFDLPVKVRDPGAEVVREPPAPGADQVNGEATAFEMPSGDRRRPQRPWALAVAGLLVAFMAAWWHFGRPVPVSPVSPLPAGTAAKSVAAAGTSIAVLPFVDMSAEQDQEHFGDGIAEEILNLLTRVEGLKVIARTSSFSFKGRQADIGTIAARLGVDHVLEGSVRKSGNRVRVTAQLVAAADSAHLWSEAYERELDDIFAVQADIATSVADVLAAKLLGDARTATRDPRAFDHFLRGRFLFHRRAPGDLEWARQHFHAAIGFDPEYAPAWAALAGVHFIQAAEGGGSPEDLEIARSCAERALALDPELPEAHLRAAAIYGLGGDATRAAEHFRVAESLDPDNPLLLGNLAGGALARGDLDAAIELNQRALARDPLSNVSRFNLASSLLAAGRLEEARAHYRAALEMNPSRADDLRVEFARINILEGRPAEAAAALESLPASVERDGLLAIALFTAGRTGEAEALAAGLEAEDSYAAAARLAEFHAFSGDTESAWAWLDRSRERMAQDGFGGRRWRQLNMISPFLRPLHGDPRWAAMYDASR